MKKSSSSNSPRPRNQRLSTSRQRRQQHLLDVRVRSRRATHHRNRRVLVFLAVWFGVNILFGVWALSAAGFEQAVAWQAHIGGFLAGLLGFSLFDPVPPGPTLAV
jgi:membrane associated rhomboid family serine protease